MQHNFDYLGKFNPLNLIRMYVKKGRKKKKENSANYGRVLEITRKDESIDTNDPI